MPIVKMPDGILVDVPDNPTPKQLRQLRALAPSAGQGTNPLKSAARLVAVGGSAGAQGLLDMPSLLASGNANHYNELAFGPGSFIQPDPAMGKFDEQAPLRMVENLGVKPQTQGEKYLATTARGAGGSVFGPGGLVKNAVIGAGAGFGAEVAAHAFGDNAVTRLIGGLVGGGATALRQAMPSNARNLIKSSTKALSDADFRAAELSQAGREALGISGLVSQHLGPNSSLHDVVQLGAANQAVRPTLLKATENVAGETDTAVKAWTDQNLPVQAADKREFLEKLQEAAAAREQVLRDQKNAAYSGKLAGVTGAYPEAYVQTLRKELWDLSKDSSEGFGKNPDTGKAVRTWVQEYLNTDGKGMDKRELGNLYDGLQAWGADKGIPGKAIRAIKAKLKSFTPELQPARDAASEVYKMDLSPMQKSLAGDIARFKGGPQSDRYTASETFINNAMKASPAEVKQLAENVGSANVGLILREYLLRGLERAAKSSKEGVNTPNTFRDLVYGTPSQRATVEAMVAEAAKYNGVSPQTAIHGARKLFDVLDSFKNLNIATTIDPVSVNQVAGSNLVGKVVAPVTGVRRFSDMLTTAATHQKIADMVTSPDGLAKIRAIAQSQDPAYAQAIVRGMLATSGGETPRYYNRVIPPNN